MEKLEKLVEISIRLSSEKNLQSLIDLILETSIDFLNCERSTLFLIDEESKELYSYSGIGVNKKEIRFPKNKGLAGYVLTTGKVVILDEPYNSPLFNKKFDQITGFKTKNILSVPLKNISGEIIGVFQALNKNNGQFSEEDKKLALAFASISTAALENTRLMAELQNQYNLLNQAYQELQQAQEIIIKQEKLATIGQFAAGISHEIKNQLAILMAVDFIKKLYPDDEKLKKYTQFIIEARNRIVSLLDEIRDFSRSNDYQKVRKNLIPIIERTIKLARFDSDLKNLNLDFNKSLFKEAYALINEDKIQQVLFNLIRNAAHASKPKSSIIISIDEDKNNWIVSVKDFGCGIPDEIHDKIWDPFFTTKSIGTGLGLDICKKIIASHNGEIYFKTKLGDGTTFFIKLPKFL